MRAALRCSAVPSTTLPRSRMRTGTPCRTVTTTSAKARGSRTRPVTRSSRSVSPRLTRPTGTSWFSRCRASVTCAGLTPYERSASGSSCTRICRSMPPTTFTPPTPVIASSLVASTCSPSVVSSRSGRSSLWMASDMIGRSFGSKRTMTGSSMSRGRPRRMRATLACTSCCASMALTPRFNCTRTSELPSNDVLVTSLRPCTVLRASSIGRDTSRSITSGDAPG